jgi:hypothetical protein
MYSEKQFDMFAIIICYIVFAIILYASDSRIETFLAWWVGGICGRAIHSYRTGCSCK